MPSFGSGLASALTQGATGYVEQQDVNRRELLALAARRRQEQLAAQKEQREAERDELLNGLTRAQTERALRPEDPPAPRNIDPLSPEGIAAAAARERATRQVQRDIPLRDPAGGDGVDRDARSRRRSYDARVNALKAALRRDFSAAMGPEKQQVQKRYYDARADLAAEFSDVAPETDTNPNTRAAAPTRTTAGAGGTDAVPSSMTARAKQAAGSEARYQMLKAGFKGTDGATYPPMTDAEIIRAAQGR